MSVANILGRLCPRCRRSSEMMLLLTRCSSTAQNPGQHSLRHTRFSSLASHTPRRTSETILLFTRFSSTAQICGPHALRHTRLSSIASHTLKSFQQSMPIHAITSKQLFGNVCVVGKPTLFTSRTYVTTIDIQKRGATLVVKRPVRKKHPLVKPEVDGRAWVTAYAVAEELNLDQLRTALEIQGLYDVHELPNDVTDGLHVQAKYSVDKEAREIFFFKEGSAVFWNMTEVERSEVLKFIQKHSDDSYDVDIIEMEQMPFKVTSEPTGLAGEEIYICESEAEEGQQVLEKYAFSNALSQAVLLGVWEASLERFVDLIEPVTEDLRYGKKIRMSRREVLRRTGELFSLRHVINLSSDLLDTPDFYWDREALEPLYQLACNYLNITRRTRVMNERLSHLCELMELLSTHLNDTHHTRLEWMIIILILVEVVFELVHYMERYLATQEQPCIEDQSVNQKTS